MDLGSATENALAWELHAWSVYATANDSAAARFGDGIKRKSPLGRLFDQGGVNPAATYSPGPGGQVPSAI
jgi:hypothetical protein